VSIYAESTLGTDTNQIQFNVFTAFPIYRVVSRQPQQRQIRDFDLPVPFESGISDFETLIGKTAYVIEGVMYPGDESGYDSGLAKLRKLANLDIEQADPLADDGYVPYVFSEFTQDKQIFMKVLYVDIPENTRKGLVQPFRLVCKIKDPTIYGATLKQANTGAADFSAATGAAGYPFGYPIGFGSSTTTVSIDADNLGDTAIYPVGISIFGPVNNPKVTNSATGEYIQVNCNLATAANNLVIQYDKDSLRVELDGISQLQNVTSGSSYFKLQPGSNIIQLTGSSIASGSYTITSFYDGYSLS
jgi:hypothetical protein